MQQTTSIIEKRRWRLGEGASMEREREKKRKRASPEIKSHRTKWITWRSKRSVFMGDTFRESMHRFKLAIDQPQVGAWCVYKNISRVIDGGWRRTLIQLTSIRITLAAKMQLTAQPGTIDSINETLARSLVSTRFFALSPVTADDGTRWFLRRGSRTFTTEPTE